jgi:hypothetical protein
MLAASFGELDVVEQEEPGDVQEPGEVAAPRQVGGEDQPSSGPVKPSTMRAAVLAAPRRRAAMRARCTY